MSCRKKIEHALSFRDHRMSFDPTVKKLLRIASKPFRWSKGHMMPNSFPKPGVIFYHFSEVEKRRKHRDPVYTKNGAVPFGTVSFGTGLFHTSSIHAKRLQVVPKVIKMEEIKTHSYQFWIDPIWNHSTWISASGVRIYSVEKVRSDGLKLMPYLNSTYQN